MRGKLSSVAKPSPDSLPGQPPRGLGNHGTARLGPLTEASQTTLTSGRERRAVGCRWTAGGAPEVRNRRRVSQTRASSALGCWVFLGFFRASPRGPAPAGRRRPSLRRACGGTDFKPSQGTEEAKGYPE